MADPRARFDSPKPPAPPCPTEEDYESLVEAGKGALENTRAILKDVGPVTVARLPKLPPLTKFLQLPDDAAAAAIPGARPSGAA
eukprot:286944-Chlamydomonas_euryale.AAC.1